MTLHLSPTSVEGRSPTHVKGSPHWDATIQSQYLAQLPASVIHQSQTPGPLDTALLGQQSHTALLSDVSGFGHPEGLRLSTVTNPAAASYTQAMSVSKDLVGVSVRCNLLHGGTVTALTELVTGGARLHTCLNRIQRLMKSQQQQLLRQQQKGDNGQPGQHRGAGQVSQAVQQTGAGQQAQAGQQGGAGQMSQAGQDLHAAQQPHAGQQAGAGQQVRLGQQSSARQQGTAGQVSKAVQPAETGPQEGAGQQAGAGQQPGAGHEARSGRRQQQQQQSAWHVLSSAVVHLEQVGLTHAVLQARPPPPWTSPAAQVTHLLMTVHIWYHVFSIMCYYSMR